jgi:hypothetical protein
MVWWMSKCRPLVGALLVIAGVTWPSVPWVQTLNWANISSQPADADALMSLRSLRQGSAIAFIA